MAAKKFKQKTVGKAQSFIYFANKKRGRPMAKEEKLIAYCGMYCGDCFGYKCKISDLAKVLRDELDQSKFEKTAVELSELKFFKVLEDYPQCNEILGILSKLQCKKACRGGGSAYCDIRNCCKEKELEGCWKCSEFENCKELETINNKSEGAHLNNLKILAEMGPKYFLKNKKHLDSEKTPCIAHV